MRADMRSENAKLVMSWYQVDLKKHNFQLIEIAIRPQSDAKEVFMMQNKYDFMSR